MASDEELFALSEMASDEALSAFSKMASDEDLSTLEARPVKPWQTKPGIRFTNPLPSQDEHVKGSKR